MPHQVEDRATAALAWRARLRLVGGADSEGSGLVWRQVSPDSRREVNSSRWSGSGGTDRMAAQPMSAGPHEAAARACAAALNVDLMWLTVSWLDGGKRLSRCTMSSKALAPASALPSGAMESIEDRVRSRAKFELATLMSAYAQVFRLRP